MISKKEERVQKKSRSRRRIAKRVKNLDKEKRSTTSEQFQRMERSMDVG